MTAGRVAFNANHYVFVRLTPLGQNALSDYYHPHGLSAGILQHHPTDADGWTRFQLWELMAIFGKCMGNGFPVPFEMDIEFDTRHP